jgi:hypothetical protein
LDPVGIYIYILLSFVTATGFQEADGMPWDPGYRLQWEDFRGTPPGSRRVAATTASGISYSYRTMGQEGAYRLDYEVTAYFYPDRSWYHPELCDSVVLSHEQLHFDISEIYARKMRNILGSRIFGPNVKAEVRQVFAQINRELSQFQQRYDSETDYSRDHEAQARWNRLIAERLTGRSHTPNP